MKFCPACLKCYEEAFDLCGDDQSHLIESPPRGLVVAGKYRIERLISRGPNVVYEGTQIKTERPVAIKLILADAGASERVRQQALAVACLSTRLDHQHVVKTCDYGQLSDGIAYVVMELVDGPTLREYLDSGGRMDAAEATRIARQMADGLEAAHACGVVHGGLNPSNIILARGYHGRPDAKIFNFGLSACRGLSPGGASPAALDEVRRYLSPEQLSGRPADDRSDVYSLGVVLHELLTGRASCAWRAAPVAESGRGESSSPQEMCCEQAPEPLPALLSEALNEKPSARLSGIAEFARRLRSTDRPAPTAPASTTPEPGPSVSDRQAPAELTDLPLPAVSQASAPPPLAARPPVRKIGLVDDYADDFAVSHVHPPDRSLSSVEGDPRPVAKVKAAAAPGQRPRPAPSETRGDSARGRHASPVTSAQAITTGHTHRSLAVALPVALILALGAFGWLASESTTPPFTNEAAAGALSPTARAAESSLPEPNDAATAAIQAEVAGLSAEDDGQGAVSVDELPRPEVEKRERVGSREPVGGVVAEQEVPDEGAFAHGAVRPRRVNPSADQVRRERAGDLRCMLMTSTGKLTLQHGDDSGEVAVGLQNGPAGPAPVTAATSDWADIAVLAGSAGTDGVSLYRIVSVSKRAGTYNVTFNSPCGAQRVVVKVE